VWCDERRWHNDTHNEITLYPSSEWQATRGSYSCWTQYWCLMTVVLTIAASLQTTRAASLHTIQDQQRCEPVQIPCSGLPMKRIWYQNEMACLVSRLGHAIAKNSYVAVWKRAIRVATCELFRTAQYDSDRQRLRLDIWLVSSDYQKGHALYICEICRLKRTDSGSSLLCCQ
jgi:hypothetical protein